jgi:hypothetical protein
LPVLEIAVAAGDCRRQRKSRSVRLGCPAWNRLRVPGDAAAL